MQKKIFIPRNAVRIDKKVNNVDNNSSVLKPVLNTNEINNIEVDNLEIKNINKEDIIYIDDMPLYDGKEFINKNQVKYVSSSNSECDSAISNSLWQSTMKSLSTLSDDVGSVSNFIQQSMNWTRDEVTEYLSPEQQDVLALMINQLNKGETSYDRGVLLGDTTGFGKGRPLMAYAAYCKRNGIFPVVFTLQENLFSNLWADVIDMNLQDTFNRPFLVNAGSSIEDTRSLDSKKIFKKIKPSELKEVIQTGDLPNEFGIIMLSYSQLNNANSVRQKFFENFLSKNKTSVILDESQAIVEMSANTSNNVSKLLELSYVSINSSATSARHIENMSSYIHIYPWLKDLTKYEAEKIGLDKRIWLSSLSVNKAITDGKMLRREHDMSGLELEMHLPNENYIEKYNHISQQFSTVCEGIINFNKIITEKANNLNEPISNGGNKEDSNVTYPDYEYKTLPIFQRLHPLSRQLLACMMAEQIASRAINSLENGEKPFIVMDMTMEAALSKIMNNSVSEVDDGENSSFDEDEQDLASKPLTLKDLMRLTLDKTSEILYKKRGERGKYESLIVDNELIKDYNKHYNSVIDLINQMDDLPASPMDYIRDIVEKEGNKRYKEGRIDKPWSICEISGRSRRVINDKYVAVHDLGKNTLIAGFNSGVYDGIIASRKASTGLSAHSSIKFLDQRPRRMIEGIGCDNPIERKQMFGRIDRRGQIHRPRYETINIGTPYNIIKIATDNAKSIELNSSVSASKDSGLLADVPDLLSPLANEIARDILSKDFALANKLGISVSEDNDNYCSPLFRRSFVLKTSEQKNLLLKFKELYADKSKDYEFENENDLGKGWCYVSQESIELIDSDESNSVVLSKLERIVNRESYTSKNIPDPLEVSNEVHIALLHVNQKENKHNYLFKFKDPWIKSVNQGLFVYNNHALTTFSRNKVGIENERIGYGIQFLKNATRGSGAYLKDKYGRLSPAIITSVAVPKESSEFFDWHKYVFNYIVPGEKRIYKIGLDTIMNNKSKYKIAQDRSAVLHEFDRKRTGRGIDELFILDCKNPLSLVLLAERGKAGKMITWTDNNNIERNSIMIAQDELNRIMTAPKRIWNKDLVIKLLENRKNVYCGIGNNIVSIQKKGTELNITMPYKARDRRQFNELAFICSNITKQDPNSNNFSIQSSDIKEFVSKIFEKFPLHYKNMTNEYILEMLNTRQQNLKLEMH